MGKSCKDIGSQMNINSTVISRLIPKYTQTHNVKDRAMSGPPRTTDAREDRTLVRLKSLSPITNSRVLQTQWKTHTIVSKPFVRRLNAERPARRPLLTQHRKQKRLRWCVARTQCSLRAWRKVHWSDESRFLLHTSDART